MHKAKDLTVVVSVTCMIFAVGCPGGTVTVGPPVISTGDPCGGVGFGEESCCAVTCEICPAGCCTPCFEPYCACKAIVDESGKEIASETIVEKEFGIDEPEVNE